MKIWYKQNVILSYSNFVCFCHFQDFSQPLTRIIPINRQTSRHLPINSWETPLDFPSRSMATHWIQHHVWTTRRTRLGTSRSSLWTAGILSLVLWKISRSPLSVSWTVAFLRTKSSAESGQGQKLIVISGLHWLQFCQSLNRHNVLEICKKTLKNEYNDKPKYVATITVIKTWAHIPRAKRNWLHVVLKVEDFINY